MIHRLSNTGALKLKLPVLPFNFIWQIETRKDRHGSGDDVLQVQATQGLWVTNIGGNEKMIPNTVIFGDEIIIKSHLDYDDIILRVQKEVDYLYQRVVYFYEEDKTPVDAIKQILGEFVAYKLRHDAVHIDYSKDYIDREEKI